MDKMPVLLKITIPLTEFSDFPMDKDESDVVPPGAGAPNLGSWYFQNQIPIEYISIAVLQGENEEVNKNNSKHYRNTCT